MAIQLFHGDDLVLSRQAFRLAAEELVKQGLTLHNLDGNTLTPPELDTALISANLFTSEAILIENLLSRPKSQAQADCLALLAAYQGSKPILLWEKKELTKTQLKALPRLQAQLFKVPLIIFKFLDSFTPRLPRKLYQQATQATDEGFLFIMLARRLSELIIAKSGDASKLSPWQRSRLISQAKSWDEAELIRLHIAFTDFDHQLKSGATKLSYQDFLDITMASLLS